MIEIKRLSALFFAQHLYLHAGACLSDSISQKIHVYYNHRYLHRWMEKLLCFFRLLWSQKHCDRIQFRFTGSYMVHAACDPT